MVQATHGASAVFQLPHLLIVGGMALASLFAGKGVKFLRLPSLIGFMIVGVLLGPSLFNLLSPEIQADLSFFPEMALGFVALSIGLELSFKTLKKQGPGIVLTIFTESFMAFIVVTALVYLVTKDLPMALIFGAIAPASAPAGTVAIIQEYKAKGSLTKALFAVVGFDDGLGIILFGFASAAARNILVQEAGGASMGFLELIKSPLIEVGISLALGVGLGFLFTLLARFIKSGKDLFILTFAIVLATTGLCQAFHGSVILANMILGMFVVNTQGHQLVERVGRELREFMPLLFVIFFTLAGANLHISALPALGLLGGVYIFGRSFGLVSGAFIGATLGKLESKIRKYLGMGILSQAGVAIGLSLIVKAEFSSLGEHGNLIGTTVITTVTATCIFFEIIGPILTKIGLQKAGEIRVPVLDR